MRTRATTSPAGRGLRVLLAAVLGLGAIVALAVPAGAAEVHIGECVEQEFEAFEAEVEARGLEPGDPEYEELHDEWEQRYEDCLDAPNLFLPETNELIWGAIGFAVVFFFIAKFGYPAIKQGLDARAERIRNDLEAAESQRTEAETILSDYRAQLADARNESARIIEESRQQADALKRDQEARLQAELAEMRERAAADIESAKQQAIADLRGEVAQLAIGAAEVVVKRSLDRDAQVQLIEDYINQVASTDGG